MLKTTKERKIKGYAIVWNKEVMPIYGVKQKDIIIGGYFDEDNMIWGDHLVFQNKNDALKAQAGNTDWKVIPVIITYKP